MSSAGEHKLAAEYAARLVTRVTTTSGGVVLHVRSVEVVVEITGLDQGHP